MQRVESRIEHLERRVSGQSESVTGKRKRGLLGVVSAELAALIDGADHGAAQHDQTDRRRQSQQKHHAQGFGKRAAEFVEIADARAARDGGQRGGRDGDAKQPQRELHEAERIAQPAYRSVAGNARGEIGDHQHVDLDRGVAEDGRSHEAEDLAQQGMVPIDGRTETEPFRAQRRQLPEKLQSAAQHHADRHAGDGLDAEVRRQDVAEDQAESDRSDIEECGGQSGHGETVTGIQHAHGLRGQCHQQQEGEHDARQLHRQLEFSRHLVETGRQQIHPERARR